MRITSFFCVCVGVCVCVSFVPVAVVVWQHSWILAGACHRGIPSDVCVCAGAWSAASRILGTRLPALLSPLCLSTGLGSVTSSLLSCKGRSCLVLLCASVITVGIPTFDSSCLRTRQAGEGLSPLVEKFAIKVCQNLPRFSCPSIDCAVRAAGRQYR